MPTHFRSAIQYVFPVSNWNLKKWFVLAFLLFVVAAPVALLAQELSAKPRLAQSNVSGCNQELFEEAERSFETRWRGSELLGRAERELSEVLRFCGDAPIRYQVEGQLKLVHEELAVKSE